MQHKMPQQNTQRARLLVFGDICTPHFPDRPNPHPCSHMSNAIKFMSREGTSNSEFSMPSTRPVVPDLIPH